jgi:pimeloyl-ACP methyl ester carboxylesterase
MRAMRSAGIVVLLALLAASGCGAHHRRSSPATTTGAAQPAAHNAPPPKLTGTRPCPGLKRFACASLAVPLDHSGAASGGLNLEVAVGPRGQRGVLVFLTGGPGQPGVPFVRRISTRLRTELRGYQLVMLDQRGRGEDALRCRALQRQVGTSDLTVPTPAAVRACAATLGPDRRFYSTADTVADLEDLRIALGAEKLTLDGVSYGTFVAERYALAHPDRVVRLVLDSVVPHTGYDPLDPTPLRAAGRVLRAVCGLCADDLAAVVRRYRVGVPLLDTLTAYSIVDPRYPGLATILRAARRGSPAALRRLLARHRRGERAPAGVLSQGLHAATLCADDASPWGGPAAPLAGRAAALARAAARVSPAEVEPFDKATLVGTGTLQTCLRWPPTPTPRTRVPATLPLVPTLLLGGDRDLSTPLEWTRREAALAPRGTLVVVARSGHGVQLRASSASGRRAATRFLRAGA